jgi:hypothetical protein
MFTPRYYEEVIDLAVARVEFRLEMMGSFIYIRRGTTSHNVIGIKLNSPGNPLINLKRREGIICAFDSIYITNAVQVGTITIFISSDVNRLRYIADSRDARFTGSNEILTNHRHCVLAATEYDYLLPAFCKGFMVKARGGPIQFSMQVGGSVADFILLADGQSFQTDDLYFELPRLIYFQSANAGTIIEIFEKYSVDEED